jgi:hypothetical protein
MGSTRPQLEHATGEAVHARRHGALPRPGVRRGIRMSHGLAGGFGSCADATGTLPNADRPIVDRPSTE